MARLLHVTASSQGERSCSREAGAAFLAAWHARRPGDTITERDVGRHPPGHVTEAWVAAAFTPPEQQTPATRAALAESDALVDELLAHDVVLISTPMYNFGVPSALKAWIDNVVRVGRTFSYDPSDPTATSALVHGKRLYGIVAVGGAGYGPGGPMRGQNFVDDYLKAIFRFMGVTDSTVLHFEGTSGGPDERGRSLAQLKVEIDRVVAG